MKTLYLHLSRQVFVTLSMTMAVFVFVMLLGEGMKDVMGLLVSREVSLGHVLRAVALLVPFVLAYALPMGLLTATLLVFGRFSADQELTAVRANGISLLSLTAPVLLIGAACSALSAWILLDLAPRSRVAFKQMVVEYATQRPEELFASGSLLETSKTDGTWVYVRKSEGARLEDLSISELREGQLIYRAEAESATVSYDEAQRRIVLKLHNLQTFQLYDDTWYPAAAEYGQKAFDIDTVLEQLRREPKLSEMTFSQLRLKAMEMDLKGIESMPARVHLHKQVAGSFACFAFTLIGIPLGLRAHRRETIAGIAIALALVGAYYGMSLFAQSMETRPSLRPDLLMWAPNVLFHVVGITLLWRGNRGG